MSSRYRDFGSKDSADSRRHQFLGQRSKTMIEESTTSRHYEDSVSPGLGRRYGSARYHRTTVNLPVGASSPVSSYQGSRVTEPSSPRSRFHSSSAEPSSPLSKYQGSSSITTSGISSQPFRFTRAASFDKSKSSRSPIYHDFASHQTDSDKNRKYISGIHQSLSSGSKSSAVSSYQPKYSSIDLKSRDSKTSTSPPLYHYQKDLDRLSHRDTNKDEESSSRSSSVSSRGSSGSVSRKSSTGSLGRDKVAYVGSYAGRTSPEISTSQDISRLSKKITKTFQRDRRGSEGSMSPAGSRSPFLRSYSLRSDYTSRYAKHQLERTRSGPAKMDLKKQSSLPEESEKKEEIDKRSRKGSWLQSQRKSPTSPEKETISSKVFGKGRSDSSSPSESSRKFSLSSKLSSSNESNTDIGGLFKKKFSVPSKYFSSKETISRESSEGSTEILDSAGTGKLKKKYSLPTKLSFRKRSASTEGTGSKSEPPSPHSEERTRAFVRSTSLDADSDKESPRGSMMRRFKFWDKKERQSPRSRSISPEGRELMLTLPPEAQLEVKAQEKVNSTEKENRPDEVVNTALISDGIKSLEKTRTKSPTESENIKIGELIKPSIEVVSKKVEKQTSTEADGSEETKVRKLSREERRARYRRGQNIGYSKSMDAAVDLTPVRNENKVENTSADSEMQPSDKLRERRRLRRLERERAFSSTSTNKTESTDSVRQSRQKLRLSVSTEDTGMSKRRSQTIASPAHQDIIESILREKPHLSREDIRPPSVKEMLKRFICEDDSSKTILESRRTKEEGRPHTICGGTLSPDEMRKFEDINFSLARQYSSDESRAVRPSDKVDSSSSDVDGRDLPLSVLGKDNGKIHAETKVESTPAAAPPSKTEKLIRKFSFKAEDDSSPHKSLFSRKHRHSPDQEEKEKEKKREKELEKEKEKEKKAREKEEKERKERERHKEKEEKARKEKEEKTRKEKEEKSRKEKEEKEEKARKEKEEKTRKEKEEKLRKEKEEKLKKEKQKLLKDEKEKLKADEKEKKEKEKKDKEKKEKEQKEKLKDKERRELEKKEKRERKHKLREEQMEKTQQQIMQAIEKRAEKTKQDEEVMSVDGVDKGKQFHDADKNQEPPECEFPREGSVSALLSLFSKADEIEKPRHPMRIHKVRPRTLAAGIAPEIIKTAREMMERRERFNDSCRTQDDSSITKRPDSMIDEPERLVEYQNQDNRIAEKNEEDRKKELRRLHKAKKARKTSATRPFGMMKTKSESNLDQPFELIHVDINLDEKKAAQEPKESKFIELTPVAKQAIPPVKITLDKKTDEGETKRDSTKTTLDDGLEEFFGDSKKTEATTTVTKADITTEDLDAISSQTTHHLRSVAEDKMLLKPKRRHATKSNPVKALKERQDVRTETEAPRTPRIEKKAVTSEHPVIRRKKKKYKDPDNLWRRHTLDLAASAIAGLASTEDFTKVTLRKTGGPEKAKEQDDYRGTKPIMLIHIKGRRNMQTRLIEPCQKSLNSGDCFVLVTKEELFAWVGKDANAIERAKVTEIASRIFTKRELDCKARDITFIEERDKDPEKLKAAKRFWKVLGADPDGEIRAADCIQVDEEYEKGMIKTNMVYKVHWTEPPSLMAVDSMCGRLPQVSILDTKEVLVFDFGSELYVWNGQQSLSGQRKTVFALGKQLFESPFEPSGIYNPLYPYGKGADTSATTNDNKTTPGRPPWALLARLHEKAETILFREKFLDWPDPTKIIKMKGHPSSGELIIKKHIPVELKPCDPKAMLSVPEPVKGEIFEGVNVGRGHGVPTRWTGDYYKEGNLCTTVGLTVWHINEFRHYELPQSNVGHFHSGEGYVIRWAYYVMNDRIAKDRKSRCRSTIAGRVRTAYYFWQGNDCTVNEKGAAAVMAVELDEERGPQVRVVQGKEPPSFLNHFKGSMIIHSGKKTHVSDTIERLSDTSIIRLYCLRNDEPTEGCLEQVKASCSSLRSRGCFILLVCRQGQMYVWYGCKATEGLKKNILVAAKAIQERKPVECNVENESFITITEVEEGSEPDAFFKALGGKKYYCSLIKDPSSQHFTPRLFELSSATGKFLSSEILCPSRMDGKVCTFPFLQEDLYGCPQPALFLLDFHYEIYVWEGWIPENDIDSLTGTGKQRWDMDRKLAMETAIKYAEEAGKRVSHRVYVVYAGLEPMSFKVAFPSWTDKPYITSIQKETGKQTGARNLVSEVLNQFTKETYSLEELQQNPPPQGVDPSKLETYLNKEDFSNIFKMNIEDFNKLPGWKQQNLKKAAGLF